MKRENFYRRDPAAALQGMVSMTLEERGVYNTIIDLLYLTWRPVENDRRYIANHCGCAVQKLNPILDRLIASGKLFAFVEDGRTYISNPRFEAERASVKGVTTRSGRGEVREKSAGVRENPPTCLKNDTDNQRVAALEKSRVEKTRASEDLSSAEPPLIEAPAKSDPDAAAWVAGVTVLTLQGGMKEPAARGFFGRLLSSNKIEARDLLAPSVQAGVNGTKDPQGFLTKAAQGIAKRRAVPTGHVHLAFV